MTAWSTGPAVAAWSRKGHRGTSADPRHQRGEQASARPARLVLPGGRRADRGGDPRRHAAVVGSRPMRLAARLQLTVSAARSRR
jgi:hypothetical protein